MCHSTRVVYCCLIMAAFEARHGAHCEASSISSRDDSEFDRCWPSETRMVEIIRFPLVMINRGEGEDERRSRGDWMCQWWNIWSASLIFQASRTRVNETQKEEGREKERGTESSVRGDASERDRTEACRWGCCWQNRNRDKSLLIVENDGHRSCDDRF